MLRIFTLFLLLSLTTLSWGQTFDGTFKPVITSSANVTAMARQSDGKIIVAGNFTHRGATSSGNILRLNADGTLDATFQSPRATGQVIDIEIQADGKILIGGSFPTVNSSSRTGIARLNSDGTLDDTFNPVLVAPHSSSTPYVNGIGKQSDNKIVIQGYFNVVNGVSHPYIARLNTDGTTDATFTTALTVDGGNGDSQHVIVQSDGKILISGIFTKVNDVAINSIARLNADGTLDSGFATNLGTGPNNSVYGLALQNDGKILFAGRFTQVNGSSLNQLARLNADGTIDGTFPTNLGFNGGNSITTVFVQPDQKIMVGGNFQAPKTRVMRLNTNGTIDNGFNPGAGPTGPTMGDVRAIEMLGTQNLLGGVMTYYNGTLRTGLVRVNSNGTLDTSLDFKLGFPAEVRATAVQGDGKIIIGGRFIYVNGSVSPNIARLTTTGAVDAFNIGIGFDDEVRALHVLATGKILAGGIFRKFDNTTVNPLIRLNTDGTRDNTFAPTVGGGWSSTGIYHIKALPGDKLLLGGGFTSINSNNIKNLAVINLDGTSDLTFVGDELTSLWLTDVDRRSDGYIIATSNINNGEVFLLNPNGTKRSTFTLNSKLSSRPETAIFDNDGNIMFGSSGNSGQKMMFKTDFTANYIPFNYQSANTTSTVRKIVKHYNKYLVGRQYWRADASQSFEWVNENGDVLPNPVDVKGNINSFQVSGMNLYIAGLIAEVNGEITTGLIRVLLPTEPVGAPSLLAGTAEQGKINLTWTDNSANEAGFDVYRSADNGSSWTQVGTATGASFTDNKVVAETAYQYYVEATNLSGNSSASNVFSITSAADIPAAPSYLIISMEAQVNAKLTWQDNSLNETEFRLYRYTNLEGTTFELYKTLPANTTTFTDEKLVAGNAYGYRVRAYNSLGESTQTDAVFATFPYMTADWINEPAAAGVQRHSAAYFVIGDKGYVGTGRNASGRLKDFWEFNPETDSWTKKKDFPGTARGGAVGFSINGKGYIGLGNDGSGTFRTDVYEYDPATDDWKAVADFPKDFNSDGGLSSAASFVIGNHGYVGLGNSGLSNVKTFMRFDPVANKWEAMAPFGGTGRPGAVGFAAKGKGYFGLGGVDTKFRDLWEYDPIANTWRQYATFPGNARTGSTAFVIQDQAYIGLGDAGDLFTENTQVNFYRHDFGNSWEWTPLPDYTGAKRSGAVAFAINNVAYVGLGSAIVSSVTTYYDDIKSYTPTIALAPASPADLAATFQSAGPTITLTWSDQSDNETAFVIERAPNSWNFRRVGTVDANTTTFSDPNVIGGATYYYRVASINNYGKRAYTASVMQVATLPPAAPSALVVKSTLSFSNRMIEVSWNDNSSNEQGFEVHVSKDGTAFNQVTTSSTKYTLSGLLADERLYFKVRAYNAGGKSEFTDLISIYTLPADPTEFKVTALTTSAITVGWKDNSTSETGYKVYRAIGSNGLSLHATLDANTTSFTDNSAEKGVRYLYSVRSVNSAGESNYAATTGGQLLPLAPTSLALSYKGNGKIRLTWVAPSSGEENFHVYRAHNDGEFEFALNVSSSVTFFEDFVEPNGVYHYKIKSIHQLGESEFSETESIDITLLTGIEDESDAKFYPNPVINNLAIRTPASANYSYIITDAKGSLVVKGDFSGDAASIDLSTLLPGIYLLKLQSEDGVITRKIIKQ